MNCTRRNATGRRLIDRGALGGLGGLVARRRLGLPGHHQPDLPHGNPSGSRCMSLVQQPGPTPGDGSQRVLYVALAGDLAIAVAKFAVAALTGSSAMLTEGVHSLVDTGNELMLLYGFRRGQRATDELLVGASLDRDQLAALRKIITADPAVESVGQLLTMRLGPNSVLLTAKLRFRRELNLDQVEQAIARLEQAIKGSYPAILHLYLESGALKQAAHAVGQVADRESLQAARTVTNLKPEYGPAGPDVSQAGACDG
jgi:hypothetical protein